MPVLDNLTPFAASRLISMDPSGADQLVICVAGTFLLPPAGRPSEASLALCDEQPSPPLVDLYWDAPGASSLRIENQSTYFRPGTDIYIHAEAHQPHGRPASTAVVRAQIGSLQKTAIVYGERRWHRGILGPGPTKPEPFLSVPLRYELAFGGVSRSPPKEGESPAFDERNPVGQGFYLDDAEALDQPLPRLEDPDAVIQRPRDRPPPVGFGPVARSWLPRRALAGTYDQAWIEERAPLWPKDFDERFFCAASSGLIASPWLSGGEQVVLEGMSPDGTIAFVLPSYRLMAKSAFRSRLEQKSCVLDAVDIDVEQGKLSLIWRVAFRAHGELAHPMESLVRVLEPWEEVV